MKKIKGIIVGIGILIELIGFCILSCEAPTPDKQILVSGLGIFIIAFGGMIAWINIEGSENDARQL